MTSTATHQAEVARGDRFEFGKNWSQFLKGLTVARIKLAERSLQTSLGMDRLDGLTFLDIGSGSGLFSLVARRLGAKVHSFDYDPDSFACTRGLQERYFPGDSDWKVQQGSVLDRDFLATLGTFDIVYSWGVLHHTGAMYEALENVKPLVPIGGRLFIAIYNDLGELTDEWARIKKTYNSLPGPVAFAYALKIIGRDEGRLLSARLREGRLQEYLKTWTEYDKLSLRGMSHWHDWIDWIGGHPYERATVEQIVDIYAADGFELSHLLDLSTGYGCNEFVFKRVAGQGVQVDVQIPGGTSMGRRFGCRVSAPFTRTADGSYGVVQSVPALLGDSRLYLLRDDRLVGPAELAGGQVRVADGEEPDEALQSARFMLVAAEERTLSAPFQHSRGKMYQVEVSDLTDIADTMETRSRSSAYLFEDGVQLPLPHATHDAIAEQGDGRFSHWGGALYFSSRGGDDPNTNGRHYRLLIAARPIPADRSFAKLYGTRLGGPFDLEEAGWSAALPELTNGHGGELLLLRDDRIIGVARPGDGRVVVAPADSAPLELENAEIYVVPGRLQPAVPIFTHARGHMWAVQVPDLAQLADDKTSNGSPVFLFEDGRQLPSPHATHNDVDSLGGGRFSHWGDALWFSASDNTDPNNNRRTYQLAIATI